MNLEQIRYAIENGRPEEILTITFLNKVRQAILDAEGECGAVGCLTISRFRGSDAMVNHDFDYYGNLPDGSYSLYPHPARSGVVSDAMIAAYVAAVNEYLGNLTEAEWQSDRLDKHAHLARVARIGLTAALEHFAKGDRHE